MWQLETAATKASSGSTAAGSDQGSFTECGELEPGTTAPPSKRHWWARLYCWSVKDASPRSQVTLQV